MLVIVKIFMALVFFFTGTSSIYANSLSPVGLWKTVDDETGEAKSLVRIWMEEGQLSGGIEKLFPKIGKNPNPLCDKCPGDKKDKPVIGLTILWGLTEDHEGWTGGHVLDPKNGKVYKCIIRINDHGTKLIVRGYIGFSLLGRSQAWMRVE